MAKSIHVGFRANPVDDKDIIEDLQRFTDKTARLKEVYRKVIALEAMAFQQEIPAPVLQEVVRAVEPSEVTPPPPQEVMRWTLPPKETPPSTGPLDWRQSFEDQKPVETVPKTTEKPHNDSTSEVKKNILGGF